MRRMYYPPFPGDSAIGTKILNNCDCHNITCPHKHIIPMQFTGLKDKNKKDIYEGDIIKDMYEIVWQVRYSLNEFGIVTTTKEFTKAIEIENYDCVNWWEGCKIIGNIYQNPELLEKQKTRKNKYK